MILDTHEPSLHIHGYSCIFINMIICSWIFAEMRCIYMRIHSWILMNIHKWSLHIHTYSWILLHMCKYSLVFNEYLDPKQQVPKYTIHSCFWKINSNSAWKGETSKLPRCSERLTFQIDFQMYEAFCLRSFPC